MMTSRVQGSEMEEAARDAEARDARGEHPYRLYSSAILRNGSSATAHRMVDSAGRPADDDASA